MKVKEIDRYYNWEHDFISTVSGSCIERFEFYISNLGDIYFGTKEGEATKIGSPTVEISVSEEVTGLTRIDLGYSPRIK